MTRPISITEVRLGPEEEALVLEVLRSGDLTQGPMVDRLERAFSALCSVRHAVAVSSGTTALVAALEAIGIRDGDEVITTPFTFAATLNAILESGATARFADIEPGALTLDPIRLVEQMTARTRMIMPVHLYGQPAAMDEIAAVAAQHDTVIVEDAAQAHGAVRRGSIRRILWGRLLFVLCHEERRIRRGWDHHDRRRRARRPLTRTP